MAVRKVTKGLQILRTTKTNVEERIRRIDFFPDLSHLVCDSFVLWICFSFLALGETVLKFHHKGVQFMEINVGQDWRNHTALRGTTVGWMILKVLKITSFQHALYQFDKTLIINFLFQQFDQKGVIHTIEEPGDVKFSKPFDASPLFVNLSECCVTTPLRAKSMRIVRKYWFIDTFQ